MQDFAFKNTNFFIFRKRQLYKGNPLIIIQGDFPRPRHRADPAQSSVISHAPSILFRFPDDLIQPVNSLFCTTADNDPEGGSEQLPYNLKCALSV